MINQQTGKDQFWKDISGTSIPFNRITPSEKLREKSAVKIAKQALVLNGNLKAFKQLITEVSKAVIDAVRTENKIDTDSKGNFTWYNFDQSIKIQIDINEMIRFDDILIDAAKEKLMQLINDNISGDAFIKSIVSDAFQTTTGRLDTKRVLGLKKHSSRIHKKEIKEKWDEAMSLIDQSITRAESKVYFRIWIKDGSGEYQNVDLNFSSISV